jgi:hypothetical protein
MVDPTGKSLNRFLDILAEWNEALADVGADFPYRQAVTPQLSERPIVECGPNWSSQHIR